MLVSCARVYTNYYKLTEDKKIYLLAISYASVLGILLGILAQSCDKIFYRLYGTIRWLYLLP